MNWKCTTIRIEGEEDFDIWHTLPLEGNINTLEAAVENWRLRTNDLSQQSLVDYINSKRKKGLAPDFWASKSDPR